MTRALTILLFLGCASAPPREATPLKVTILPALVDMDKVLPPAVDKPVVAPPGVKRFEDTPIDGGKLCDSKNRCQDLEPGILVDEVAYAQGIADKSTLKRLTSEAAIMKTLRAEEHRLIRAAESEYQNHIVDLRKENAELRRPKLWNELKFYVGFALGVGLSALTVYSVERTVR